MRLPAYVGTLLALGFIAATAALAGETELSGTVRAVDAERRTITIVPAGKADAKQLDVARKAPVTVNGTRASLGELVSGQRVKLTYHGTLEVVTSIRAERPSVTEILNVDELNTAGPDMHPWLSEDGLRIYWASPGDKGSIDQGWIWTAARKDVRALFENKKKLFRGHGPVLTGDERELYFRSLDTEGVLVASRESKEEAFGRPRSVAELQLAGRDPGPRGLSPDGLTLYLDLKTPGSKGTYHTWVMQRKDRHSPWGAPRRVETKLATPYAALRFVFAQPSADGLRLFCTAGLPGKDGKETILLGVLSRATPAGPFTSFQRIVLKTPTGITPLCFSPRYVAATRELFFSSRDFFATRDQVEKGRHDLWVVKDFTPPPAPARTAGK